jgi:alpha-L-rhamnosidase
MLTFASLMGDKRAEKNYALLADRLAKLMKEEFWDQSIPGEINRQTLFSTLLYHQIIPENEIAAAKDSLLHALEEGPSGHFNTGIFGTKYILETLSDHASPDLVYQVVNSTIYPGWGYMMDRGATTIWETWKESDNTYSNCHPMFGSITEWYYRWLGGIRPDPEYPGFKEFVLAPFVPEGLEYVQCSYESPYGKIVSNWKVVKEGVVQYNMKIPEGSKARLILALKPDQHIEMRRNQMPFEALEKKGVHKGEFTLDEGDYLITVSTVRN